MRLFKTQGGILACFITMCGALLFLVDSGALVQAEKPKDAAGIKENPAIEKTKEKGFEGVDFSYDLFGAPPGQSATKIAEDAMAKDVADKPKVMAKQAR
ncbi:MAG: hypothetical protein ABI856_20655, partial [Nitrospira sp.]